MTTLHEIPLSQAAGIDLSLRETKNDMQLGATASQLQPLPMATELAVFHGHHWDIAYRPFSKRGWFNKTSHPFPKRQL